MLHCTVKKMTPKQQSCAFLCLLSESSYFHCVWSVSQGARCAPTANTVPTESHMPASTPTDPSAGRVIVGGMDRTSWAVKCNFVCIHQPFCSREHCWVAGKGCHRVCMGTRARPVAAVPREASAGTTGIIGVGTGCQMVEKSIYLLIQGFSYTSITLAVH